MRNGHVDWGGGVRAGEGGLRGARVVGRALRGHVTTGNLGGEGSRASAPGSAPAAAAGVGARSRTGEEGGRALVCVSLSSHLRRSSRRDLRGGGGGGGGGCFVQLCPPHLLFLFAP